MIDVIGNIKINENDRQRLMYFISSYLSLDILHHAGGRILLCIDEPTRRLINLLTILNDEIPFIPISPESTWGGVITKAITRTMLRHDGPDFYLQFEEDHFFQCNDIKFMAELLSYMKMNQVDVCRASFHPIEFESQRWVNDKVISDAGYCFDMTWKNHQEFQKKWPRYFIGTNCIFSKSFASRLFDRAGTRPHDYEFGAYNDAFRHRVIVPRKELLRSLDDDHGLMGSSMLLKPTDKYKDCLKRAKKLINYY